MTTEPYHHGNLRQALLDAAECLLADKGLDEVSTRAVAKAVGVSHNAPYRHFPNRDALLAGLAQQGFERLIAAFQSALVGISDPKSRLMAVSHAYMAFAAQHRSIYLLMFSQVMNRLAFPGLDAAAQGALKCVCEIVEEIRGAEDAELHAKGAWAMVHGIAILMIEERLMQDTQYSDTLLNLALDNYIRGMTTGS